MNDTIWVTGVYVDDILDLAVCGLSRAMKVVAGLVNDGETLNSKDDAVEAFHQYHAQFRQALEDARLLYREDAFVTYPIDVRGATISAIVQLLHTKRGSNGSRNAAWDDLTGTFFGF